MTYPLISPAPRGFSGVESDTWQVDDGLWSRLAPFLHEAPIARRPGRPRRDDRAILNALLWLLRTGAQWRALPAEFGAPSTCYGRFQEWVATGAFARALTTLQDDYQRLGGNHPSARVLAREAGISPFRFRRLLTRWDRRDANYEAWRQLAALVVISRRLDHAAAARDHLAEERLAS